MKLGSLPFPPQVIPGSNCIFLKVGIRLQLVFSFVPHYFLFMLK